MPKMILGLGNPGDSYDMTRHNIGFYMLDAFAASHGLTWLAKPRFRALIAEYKHHNEKILLVKPQTFYNLAGESARLIKDFYKIINEDILIIHDELALPFGSLRTRGGGSDAGNNGVKNLSQHLGNDTSRIRIGIDNEHQKLQPAEVFVLNHFTTAEQGQLPVVAEHVHAFIQDFIDETRTFAHTSVKT